MVNDNTEEKLQADVETVKKIPIIASLLDVVCRTTGMGFAAVARVTEDRWITCGVLDKIKFGLAVGDELKIETTLCNEIRQSNREIIIDNVNESKLFGSHPTPALYGFQSYISVPITRSDGRFFGTLCAIDPNPARLSSPEIIGMFNLFSSLISFHLDAVIQLEDGEANVLKEREERLKAIEQKNRELQKMNAELEAFAYVASHDLQEPLRKIQTFSDRILTRDNDTLSADGKEYLSRMIKAVKRMERLINDLFTYTKVGDQNEVFEKKNIAVIVDDFINEYKEDLNLQHATIEVGVMCSAYVIPFQFYQLLQNLVGNSVKFSKPGIDPVIKISAVSEAGNSSLSDKLSPEKHYCHITISDNGIGFEPQYSEKIFKVFQRLHGKEEYEGTGIGLSIVKKIVDNHQGFIAATAEVDKGAQFDIYIPQP